MKRILCALALMLAASTAGATVASFPPADTLSSEHRTNAEMKVYLENWLAATKQLPGGATWATVGISSGGTATLEQAANYIDSYVSGAGDNLDNLGTSLPQGSIVILRAFTPSTEPITVRQVSPVTGSMYLENGGSFLMDSDLKYMVLIRRGNYWHEIARQYGTDEAGFVAHWNVLPDASPDWTGDGASGPRLDLTSTVEATPSSTTHALTLGSLGLGKRLVLDTDEVQAVSAMAASSLYLNPSGGSVYTGTGNSLIWHAGNDGTGSGLDADLLDGVTLDDINAKYAMIEDQRSYGANGDNSTSGYNSRQLDTEVVDADGIVTINTASDYFTLGAGRYRIYMAAGATGVGRHMAFLFHYGPPETMLLRGSEAYAGTTAYMTYSTGWVDCELSGSTNIYMIHYAANTVTAGFGVARSYSYSGNNFPESYAQVHIWKLAS